MKARLSAKLKEIKRRYNEHRKNVNECAVTQFVNVGCWPMGVKEPKCAKCEEIKEEYRKARIEA